MRQKNSDKPSVRDRIVVAALDQFHTEGYNGRGVQEIADAAGVPKGTFYNHFKSKELLALDVLQLYIEGNSPEMLLDTSQPPLERLRAHFGFISRRYAECGFSRGCLLGNFSAEMADVSPALREALDKAFGDWTQGVASLLREAQAAGQIDSRHDPELLARFLINSWEGALLRMKVVKARQPLDDFYDVCFGVLLK
ncbi:TetR family transcriptional regulator [Capsulimonas corticalis]|uniref:TetR family transcriptional regulator n=1 Tax=Capsulimonas corticalis TaxID=2219043 RepID=A0A402D0N3_9BACT|nr:TetR/AcrR family transcriptional regulator [Capsulimonas corticalis]BDI33590.1 TetR family transcriptional regulator [Capsulimonas corticalis]